MLKADRDKAGLQSTALHHALKSSLLFWLRFFSELKLASLFFGLTSSQCFLDSLCHLSRGPQLHWWFLPSSALALLDMAVSREQLI